MSHDISVDGSPSLTRVTFDDFVATDLDHIARALVVMLAVVDGAGHHTALLEAALDEARGQWQSLGFEKRPGRFVFSQVVAAAADDGDVHSITAHNQLIDAACAVARHGLAWSIDEVGRILDLAPDDVVARLATLDGELLIAMAHGEIDGAESIPQQIRSAMASASVTLPDTAALDRSHRHLERRRRTARACVAIAALVMAVVSVAQFMSRPERLSSADLGVAPVPSARPVPQPTSTGERASPRGPSAVDGTPIASLPDLITTDGKGGFVGVYVPIAARAPTRFAASDDGRTWELAVEWFADDVAITRFERSGDHYVAWLGPLATSSYLRPTTIATSTNLLEWTELTTDLDEEPPLGLKYEPTIDEVLVRGTDVLALVSLNVGIDYAALLLAEGYTCGRTIDRHDVSVNLCNGRELNVLGLSGTPRLPDPKRLLLSRDGAGFVTVDAPLTSVGNSRLTVVNDAIAITTAAGELAATSIDGVTWEAVGLRGPPGTVRVATIARDGGVAGFGSGADALPIIFHNEERRSESVTLAELIGPTQGPYEVRAASGPNHWTIYVEYGSTAWLLSSRDGTTWDVIEATPVGEIAQLQVGDHEALITSIDNEGTTLLQILSLS